MKAFTKDGIENTFGEISVITTIRKDKLVPMTKKFGAHFKEVLVFDRIKEELRSDGDERVRGLHINVLF